MKVSLQHTVLYASLLIGSKMMGADAKLRFLRANQEVGRHLATSTGTTTTSTTTATTTTTDTMKEATSTSQMQVRAVHQTVV